MSIVDSFRFWFLKIKNFHLIARQNNIITNSLMLNLGSSITPTDW